MSGDAAMMEALGVDARPAEAALHAEGKTAMFVAVDGTFAGVVAVGDPSIRRESRPSTRFTGWGFAHLWPPMCIDTLRSSREAPNRTPIIGHQDDVAAEDQGFFLDAHGGPERAETQPEQDAAIRYEGEPCGEGSNGTSVRNGNCRTFNTCGGTSGCG